MVNYANINIILREYTYSVLLNLFFIGLTFLKCLYLHVINAKRYRLSNAMSPCICFASRYSEVQYTITHANP